MSHLFALALAGIATYYLVIMLIDFAAQKGTLVERLLAAGKGSATKLWARFVALASAGIGAFIGMADQLHNPHVAEVIHLIQKHVGARWVALSIVVIMVMTEVARNRTLEK